VTLVGVISVAYRIGPERSVPLDARSIVTVDSPRGRLRGDTQPRDATTLRNPLQDEEIVGLAFDRGVLTAERVSNGGPPFTVDLPIDAKSVLVAEGPGRTAAGLDFVNRVTSKVPLAGAASVTYRAAA
jgi:hypothetical protein